jgi:hypothetical protein
MRPEFAAIPTIGAVVSLAGVACSAALPLPDYRWYNRLAVVLLMGFGTTLVFLAGLWDLWMHDQSHQTQGGVALGLGLPLIVILFITLRTLRNLYPDVTTQARLRTWGVQLMPIGMMVQVVPSLLVLAGVRI